MRVVHIVVPADGVHIRIDPFPLVKSVTIQRHPFPFRQRLHDLHRGILDVEKIKSNAPFHTVQSIVQSALRIYEQRRADALQIHFFRKSPFERIFDPFDRFFHLPDFVDRTISFSDFQHVSLCGDFFVYLTTTIRLWQIKYMIYFIPFSRFCKIFKKSLRRIFEKSG